MKNALTGLFLLVFMLPFASRGGEEWKRHDLAGVASIEAPSAMDGSLEKSVLPNAGEITTVYDAAGGKCKFAVYIYDLKKDDKDAIENELARWDGLKVTSRKEIKGEKYEGIEITEITRGRKVASIFSRIVRSKNRIFRMLVTSETPMDAEVMAMKKRFFDSFMVK